MAVKDSHSIASKRRQGDDPPSTAANAATPFSITRHIVFASCAMAVLVAGIGGWAAMAQISGAVIASGTFVVERNVKKVQHSYGGIVSEINVRNGDRVNAGDVLIRLDATQIRSELGIVRSQLNELAARAARLAAERDGRDAVSMPKSLLEKGDEAQLAADGETRVFNENKRTRESQKEQLQLRIEQFREEIIGLEAQRDAKSGELKIIQLELEQLRHLHEKRLTPVSRVYAMEREERRLGGDRGGLIAQIARAKGQINEINVQVLAVDENARAQAQKELRSIEAKLAELAEREIAALDKLVRVDLRAPQKGVVHELAAHTVGGVVTAAEPVMLIVPEEENLTIEAHIAPRDVDQVAVGNRAKLMLSAFNQQKTPEVMGFVAEVSADVTVDPKTGQNYYVARLQMDDKESKRIGDLKLVPGMPVEVFVATGERTALSYLAKPFTDQVHRAFRE